MCLDLKPMKSVLEYEDYRLYLQNIHDFHGREQSRFSWRAISKRAGIKNSNFLRQVALGERNFSSKTAERVGIALGLSGRELEYWHRLVHFCQANGDSMRERYRMELAEMRGNVRSNEISSGGEEYYSSWFIPCIRELITLYDFQEDYALLAKSVIPPITEAEARKAVQMLEKFHFIEKDGDGRWVETDRALRSGSSCRNTALIHYHCEMLGKAAHALKTLRKEDRFAMGMTLGVSKECYRMILAEVEKFKNRVTSLVLHDRRSDLVMQMALQIFPTGVSPEKMNLKGVDEMEK